MKIVVDIECNSLSKPTKIWCIVCKDIDTGELHIFRNLMEDCNEKQRFLEFATEVELWIGHNILGYDYPILRDLLDWKLAVHCFIRRLCVLDTLILSKLVDYSRKGGHSIEQYGEEFGLEKIKFNTFTHWSQEMEDYCVRDVDICTRIYNSYKHIVDNPTWYSSIHLEHRFQLIANDLHDNGFGFNGKQGALLLARVSAELDTINKKVEEAFPPREVLIREFTPKLTKFGTISRTSVPRSLHSKIHEYVAGKTYQHTRFDTFNASSHKQLITVLTEAGWKPEDKTQTHIDTERKINKLKYSMEGKKEVDLKILSDKLELLKKNGWKINEHNLGTLPESAPTPARLLAKRILLEARRRTLTEWLGLVQDDGRIRGKFLGIGAWTHRMAHQQPNTANIPREFNIDKSPKLLGKEMRSLWIAPKNRLLVGCDAEGIQLRIFAHYIDDLEFTKALVEGRKDEKTDPHSLNQKILGDVCKSRDASKRFVYALLLGAGVWKLSQILGCSESETKKALTRLLERYEGWKRLKSQVILRDSQRGYFIGLDGRKVRIPGDLPGERRHLCMSGYLQNGEALIIKKAAILTDDALVEEKILKKWMFVNIVHDELQSETVNNMDISLKVAKIKADAIKSAGEYYKLKCPLAGSYYNEDTKDYTIGTNWYKTH